MALYTMLSIGIAIVCVLVAVLKKNGYLLSYIKWGSVGIDDKQHGRPYTTKSILNLLKSNQLFPVCCAQGWLLSTLHHGHRVWSRVVSTDLAAHSLTLYSAYAKVHASSQVVLQLLKDVGKTCEWSPRVVSCTQVCPTQGEEAGRRKPYPSLPVQQDQVREVLRMEDSLLEGRKEVLYKRIWHREDNGCCWMLKMCESSQAWMFFLAQPTEDAEHSLLTVITPELPVVATETTDVTAILGCLADHLYYRKAEFTPLLSITVPPSHVLEPNQNSSSEDEAKPMSNNNNSSKEDTSSSENHSRKFENAAVGQNVKNTPIKEDVSKGDKQSRTLKDETAAVSILRPVSRSAPPAYVMKFAKTGDKSISSTEEFQCSLSQVNLPQVSTGTLEESFEVMPIRRVESDSSLFMKPKSTDGAASVSQPQNCAGDRQKTKVLTLANQSAAELLVQSFKASSVDINHNDTANKTWENCPGGWMFSGLDSEVVILRRLFKNGMSTQSYMGKGMIHASPKTVFDAIRNPRMKFTYDETLKKVDIIETVSDTVKIVYFYHEILQLFRKDSCDFCILQSERVDGDKFVLSLQSVDSLDAPPKNGTVRGKLLPSGWIVEPVRKNKKIISMVTFLMQMDFGPGKGSSLPFEDIASRQPLAIVHLREYFKPLTELVQRGQPK